MNTAIESVNISKSYGAVKALDDLTFSVNETELFGFIGPDGAGKTTLFRLISTLLLSDTGRLKVLGKDCRTEYRELRKDIGYMPGRFSLYQDLTVEENLQFWATVFGTTIHENYNLIADIYSHIEPFRKRPAGKLSGGMKQKLALSCALIHRPRLLVLDEPTTGVDAVSRKEFWEMLGKLKNFGITIVVSTPYMDEAMQCDRVALIQAGKILTTDSPLQIRKSFPARLFTVRSAQKHRLLNALKEHESVLTAYPFGDSVHVTFVNDSVDISLLPFLNASGLPGIELQEAEPGIEDVFLGLMNKPAS